MDLKKGSKLDHRSIALSVFIGSGIVIRARISASLRDRVRGVNRGKDARITTTNSVYFCDYLDNEREDPERDSR